MSVQGFDARMMFKDSLIRRKRIFSEKKELSKTAPFDNMFDALQIAISRMKNRV